MRDFRHTSQRWALLLGAMLVQGCMVGPTYTRPEPPLAPKWTAQAEVPGIAQTPIDVQWWKSFNDSALNQLVDLAYRQNLQLEVTGLRIAQARAQLGIATGNAFPQTQELFADVTGVGLSQDAANTLGFDRNFGDFRFGFDAAWELDFWGKYRRGVQAETAAMLGSIADYQNAVISLTAEVARTYVVIRTHEMLVKQAHENARLQEQALAIAQARLANGATSELDVAQATTLLESTRATIPKLRITMVQARNALNTLLGRPAGTVDFLLDGQGKIPAPPATVGVSVPAEMLRRRPDIRGAELRAVAQCARVGVARAELFPSFSLFGRVGFQAASGANLEDPLQDIFYAFGPSVHWPFFNYGRIENAVRVEDARLQESMVGYRDTVLRAAQEVEDSLTGFVHAREAMEVERRSVVAAQRSVEIALVQYREGAADFQRVIDAQRSLLQQENTLTQTSSVTTHLIALYKALGGGWELTEGHPVISQPAQEEMSRRTHWGGLLFESTVPGSAVPPPAKR